MKYTNEYFDQYVERRGTRNVKWDGCNKQFHMEPSAEAIPMWVADMDFLCPQEVIEAVKERAAEGIYGYPMETDSFDEAIISWVKRRYGWDVKKEWIVFTPGVVPGFTVAVQQFTEPGDRIIVQPPVYYPFMDVSKSNGRINSKPYVKYELVRPDCFRNSLQSLRILCRGPE